jgi:hypothetical protein
MFNTTKENYYLNVLGPESFIFIATSVTEEDG